MLAKMLKSAFLAQENFVLLVRELRQELDKYGYLLTAAVAAGEETMSTAYNVPEISKYAIYFIMRLLSLQKKYENDKNVCIELSHFFP
jgi:spore germination protein YaaH